MIPPERRDPNGVEALDLPDVSRFRGEVRDAYLDRKPLRPPAPPLQPEPGVNNTMINKARNGRTR